MKLKLTAKSNNSRNIIERMVFFLFKTKPKVPMKNIPILILKNSIKFIFKLAIIYQKNLFC